MTIYSKSGESPTEYTDLSCNSPETANAVLAYLNNEMAQEEEPPSIAAYVERATVRITYRDVREREQWDMQLLGFRDGYDAPQAANKELREALGAMTILLLQEAYVDARQLALNVELDFPDGVPSGTLKGELK